MQLNFGQVRARKCALNAVKQGFYRILATNTYHGMRAQQLVSTFSGRDVAPIDTDTYL